MNKNVREVKKLFCDICREKTFVEETSGEAWVCTSRIVVVHAFVVLSSDFDDQPVTVPAAFFSYMSLGFRPLLCSSTRIIRCISFFVDSFSLSSFFF